MPLYIRSKNDSSQFPMVNWRRTILLIAGAACCFHAAYFFEALSFLIFGYVICLAGLARLDSTRGSWYSGLLAGLLCFAPPLEFFWTIFGSAAIVLWLVLASWTALFVALTQITLARFGPRPTALLVPVIWTGCEYFRSELYYLKFSWLNVSYAFAVGNGSLLCCLGMYGLGFLAATAASAWLFLRPIRGIIVAGFGLAFLAGLPHSTGPHPAASLQIAGVQLEYPIEQELIAALDKLLIAHKETNILVLSEYTLDGLPSNSLKAWCKNNARYLVVGGKEPSGGGNYYNTAFVISPSGEVVFRQGKSVPIPFFADGLPAPRQSIWDSPWGKIGICICYDLSYTRVTDELVRQGAQLLIVPTMDVEEWGANEHALHARVAPVRAAEYGVPIFRLASSGISQAVDERGKVIASSRFPGKGETIWAGFSVPQSGSLPWDRWGGPFCVWITGLLLFLHLIWKRWGKRSSGERMKEESRAGSL